MSSRHNTEYRTHFEANIVLLSPIALQKWLEITFIPINFAPISCYFVDIWSESSFLVLVADQAGWI